MFEEYVLHTANYEKHWHIHCAQRQVHVFKNNHNTWGTMKHNTT